MARAFNLISKQINPIPSPYPTNPKTQELEILHSFKIKSSSRKDDLSLIRGKIPRTPRRRLITIATSDGKWSGKWTSDYIFTLQELRLSDLVEVEDGQKDAEVYISLNVDKHASFGFSVKGRIITSFTRKCSNCSSPYCREIDTTFDVWVLPSSRDNRSIQLPEIGGDDPSVIYVKPGCEADLDTLIQDTIRLTTSVKETCSDSCENAEPKLQYVGVKKEASLDRRWSRLLELKKRI